MEEIKYMIGDILMAHYNDGEQEFDFPVVIDGIDENGTLVDGTCYLSWHPLLPEHKDIEYAEELKPIPLTEEILKANGFIGRNYWYCKRVHDNGVFLVAVALKYCEIEISKICGAGTDCEECDYGSTISFGSKEIYVHQLQMALRCCGLWDIANNFKLKE